jgi:peptidoglycan/xylan/chitin deacetylase (PgdA/CDA1 family)
VNSYNTIVLHSVVEGQSKSFIDITLETLRHILKASMSMGQLVSIDQAIVSSDDASRSICLTFDDGFSSDHDLVLPELKRIKATATFFIVTDWLGTPGYLTEQQVRDLSDSGMQIGSHSKSHPNFLTITPEERLDELRGSKLILENIIGKEISTFSFPHGFCDMACTQAVFAANYSICCTSAHGVSSRANPVVSRNSINAHTSLNRIEKILRASLIQRVLWYFEDIIKENLKQSFPKFYIALRNLMSAI